MNIKNISTTNYSLTNFLTPIYFTCEIAKITL